MNLKIVRLKLNYQIFILMRGMLIKRNRCYGEYRVLRNWEMYLIFSLFRKIYMFLFRRKKKFKRKFKIIPSRTRKESRKKGLDCLKTVRSLWKTTGEILSDGFRNGSERGTGRREGRA